jgi:hypothetical protein
MDAIVDRRSGEQCRKGSLGIRNILGINCIVPKWEEIQPSMLHRDGAIASVISAVEKRVFMRAAVTKSEQRWGHKVCCRTWL